MHSNFEGSTDSPLENLSFQRWPPSHQSSSTGKSFPAPPSTTLSPSKSGADSWAIFWWSERFCVSIPQMSFLVIQKLIYLPVHPQCRSSLIPFCINLSMSFNWVSAVSYLAFFCDELIFSSCDLCCFRESSLGGFLLFEFWWEKLLVFGFSLLESTSLVHFFIIAFLSVSGSKGSESSTRSLVQVLNCILTADYCF